MPGGPSLTSQVPTDPDQLGPTAKVGRQVARSISVEQAARLQPLIDADRRLHKLVRELEAFSLGGIQQFLD